MLDNQQLHHVTVVWRLATLLTIASIYFILSETLLNAYTEISFYFRMQTCDFRISIERLVEKKKKHVFMTFQVYK